MRESDKAMMRRVYDPLFHKVFKGKGIDIGAGPCLSNMTNFPLVVSLESFDKIHGDAQYITQYREKENFDFVISSHCLEHMVDPLQAIREWWHLLKYGGYLIITVPDEDLYEQGMWPSPYNSDHKWRFTLAKYIKNKNSIDVFDLVNQLWDYKLIQAKFIDTHYEYDVKKDQTYGLAECSNEIILKKEK